MTKLHEVLAAEKTVKDQIKTLLDATTDKFRKPDNYFRGYVKTLKMIQDTPENQALEAQAREDRPLTTNVYETLDYVFNFWANSEDFQARKNEANTRAKANIEFRGNVILTDVPVDEILGLSDRLTTLRGVLMNAPTLDSSRKWNVGSTKYTWAADKADVGTKTERKVSGVILAPATDKHPAQIEKVTSDVVIGTTSQLKFSGELTAQQKADLMAAIDELISEVNKARSRCNEVEVNKGIQVGSTITNILRSAIMQSGEYGN